MRKRFLRIAQAVVFVALLSAMVLTPSEGVSFLCLTAAIVVAAMWATEWWSSR